MGITNNVRFVNLYADESMSRECPYTGDSWDYIGLIVEDINNPLLPDIISERFDQITNKDDPKYHEYDHILHWHELHSGNTRNVCKRWFNYTLHPSKRLNKLFFHLLGINNTKLNSIEFDESDIYNSKYNRFFRALVKYSLQTFFIGQKVVVKNIFHEEGQQQNSHIFPWHIQYRLPKEVPNIGFDCQEIIFLPKDHKINERSNILQFCDCLMGAFLNIIHGINDSKRARYRRELMNQLLPLVERVTMKPENKNSSYGYHRKIMVSFFPRINSSPDSFQRNQNQFYSNRKLKFLEESSGQGNLFGF